MKKPTLAELEERARRLGASLSKELPTARGYGFALLVFNLGEGGHMSYVSNSKREDMIEALEEMLMRLKTQTVAPTGAPNHPFNKFGKS